KVRVFSGADASQMFELSLESDFNGGVRVAGGDVNGDGYADVVVAAGPGGPPRVCVFDGKTHMAFQDFFADSPNGRAGLQVAAGDLDHDTKADIATVSEGGSTVRVFRGKDNASVGQFAAFTSESTGGARLALGDFDGNGSGDVAAGYGPGGGLVRLLDGI